MEGRLEDGLGGDALGGLTYAEAGVNIDAGEEAVRRIRASVESTFIPGVLGDLGGFGGLFEVPSGLRNPVLVAATDGVGTKVLLARDMGRLDTVGIDLVAMSANDVLTLGARPLFFLDYIATGRLLPDEITMLVSGVAEGCRQAGCALLGGETAEMPGLYAAGEFDLAGFCVGVVEKARIVDGSQVQLGDVVLGLASSGVHSNGYTLVRRILELRNIAPADDFPLDARNADARAVGDVLLEPTRIYVRSVLQVLERGVPVRAMAHITGGGLAGNLSRVIPQGLRAALYRSGWTVPRVFTALQEFGGVSDAEMFRTFNMGIGFVLVTPEYAADEVVRLLSQAGEQVYTLGTVERGEPRVVFVEGGA